MRQCRPCCERGAFRTQRGHPYCRITGWILQLYQMLTMFYMIGHDLVVDPVLVETTEEVLEIYQGGLWTNIFGTPVTVCRRPFSPQAKPPRSKIMEQKPNYESSISLKKQLSPHPEVIHTGVTAIAKPKVQSGWGDGRSRAQVGE